MPAFSSDFTLFGGLQREGKITLRNAASTVPSSITFNPKNFGTFGVRAGVGKNVIGTETTFAYSPNWIDSSVKAAILSQDLMLQVPTPKVKPYVTAGLGPIFTKGNSLTDIGSKFAINYGGGIKFFPAPGPVGGRIDFRNYSIPSIEAAVCSQVGCQTSKKTLNMIEVSVGVVFAF